MNFSFKNDVMFLVQRLNNIKEDLSLNELKILKYKNKIEDIKNQLSLANRAKETYKVVVDEVYRRSMGEIEEVLNMALQFIFFDKNYSVKIEIGDYRGKTVEILLYDNDIVPPRVVDMKNGVGNGVRCVVSFVLLSYYLISLGRKHFIFSDEAYSGISEAYVDRYFSFIHSLCEKKEFKFVLITHDGRFIVYGDKSYSVSEGNVVEVNSIEDTK